MSIVSAVRARVKLPRRTSSPTFTNLRSARTTRSSMSVAATASPAVTPEARGDGDRSGRRAVADRAGRRGDERHPRAVVAGDRQRLRPDPAARRIGVGRALHRGFGTRPRPGTSRRRTRAIGRPVRALPDFRARSGFGRTDAALRSGLVLEAAVPRARLRARRTGESPPPRRLAGRTAVRLRLLLHHAVAILDDPERRPLRSGRRHLDDATLGIGLQGRVSLSRGRAPDPAARPRAAEEPGCLRDQARPFRVPSRSSNRAAHGIGSGGESRAR